MYILIEYFFFFIKNSKNELKLIYTTVRINTDTSK